jgi:hypothetical protein
MGRGVGCAICDSDSVAVSPGVVGDCVGSGSGDCVGELSVGVGNGVASGVGSGWTGSGVGEGSGSGVGVGWGSGVGSGLAVTDWVGEIVASLMVADCVSGDNVVGSIG